MCIRDRSASVGSGIRYLLHWIPARQDHIAALISVGTTCILTVSSCVLGTVARELAQGGYLWLAVEASPSFRSRCQCGNAPTSTKRSSPPSLRAARRAWLWKERSANRPPSSKDGGRRQWLRDTPTSKWSNAWATHTSPGTDRPTAAPRRRPANTKNGPPSRAARSVSILQVLLRQVRMEAGLHPID